MRNVVAVVWTVLLLGVWSEASAQCSALVKDGVFETFDSSSENVSVSAFMNWLRDHRSSSSSSSAGGGISIPLIGSLNGSSEQYSQLESDYAAMNAGNSAARSRLITHARSVSAALAQRFNECLAIRGLHVWLETTSNRHVFKIAAVFNSPGEPTRAVINDVDRVPSDMTCSGVIARGTVIGGSTQRMRCTRHTEAAVAITINANSDPIGGGELELAAIPPPTPPPPTTCDSQALVSRDANASNSRLTDSTIGSESPGQNSNRACGQDSCRGVFWIELAQPEWIHHLVLHPYKTGTPGTNTIVAHYADGHSDTIATQRTNGGPDPIIVYTDPTKSKNVKKVEIDTTPYNPAAFVAWVEIEVFACHKPQPLLMRRRARVQRR